MAKIENGTATAVAVKKYLVDLHRACSVCNRKTWNKVPIPIEIDHIDGDHSNNRLENLRLICCNCHAQTATYKSKNNGSGRHKRSERYRQGKSY